MIAGSVCEDGDCQTGYEELVCEGIEEGAEVSFHVKLAGDGTVEVVGCGEEG